MNKILAKRYSFCDFSKIVGFPNLVPSRDEWENSIPRLWGEEWEVLAEHLLDFHVFIHWLQIVHEDVHINLFGFSLDKISHDWYWSLPTTSINSLTDLHASFHSFCKDKFSIVFLYLECCHEFNLLSKQFDSQENYVVVEDTSHYDQEIGDLHNHNHSIDSFDVI